MSSGGVHTNPMARNDAPDSSQSYKVLPPAIDPTIRAAQRSRHATIGDAGRQLRPAHQPQQQRARPAANWGRGDPLTLLIAQRLSCGLSSVPPHAIELANRRSNLGARKSSLGGGTSGNNPLGVEPPVPGGEEGEPPDEPLVWESSRSFWASSNADPSLIFAMERTYFGALNQAMILTVSGIGLMSVGPTSEVGREPGEVGVFLVGGGLAYALAAFAMHAWRMSRLNAGLGLGRNDSLVWTGTLAALIVVSLVCEIYFGLKFPYLRRSKSVEVVGVGAENTTLL